MLIAIDENDERPIYMQIVYQVKEQVQSGDLNPGDTLPSVRELGESLGINLHTVHSAYKRLREQGVITLRLGQRAKIAKLRESPASCEEVEAVLGTRLKELTTEAFHLGISLDELRSLFENHLEVIQHKGV